MDKNMFIGGVAERYSPVLLQDRISTEGNVIACLLSDILLIDEVKLDKNSFLTKDGRFLFNLLRDLRNKHLNTIDEVSLISNSSDEVMKRLEELGGYSTLEMMMGSVHQQNFDSYLDKLYRENIILQLHDAGFNVLKKVNYDGERILPIEIFRKMTSEQVIDFYQLTLSAIDNGQSSKIIEENELEFDDKWLRGLEEGEAAGVPYESCGVDVNGDRINVFPYLSRQTMGIHKKNLGIISGFSGVGKSTYLISLIFAQAMNGEKVLVISNEEEMSVFKSKMMVWILAKYCRYYNLTRTKLEGGYINDEDRRQMKLAKAWYKEYFRGKIFFIGMNCTDMEVVSKKIREYVLKKGVTLAIFDTFKLAETSFVGQRQDLSLVKDSRTLFNLARKYDIAVLMTQQIGEAYKGTLYLHAGLLSNSKATKEICNLLLMIRRAYDVELDPKSKNFCHPFRRKYNNGKWIEEDFDADMTKNYCVMFIDKNRSGNDSGNGEGFLLEFDPAHALFREVAYCRPKHGNI